MFFNLGARGACVCGADRRPYCAIGDRKSNGLGGHLRRVPSSDCRTLGTAMLLDVRRCRPPPATAER